MKKLNQISLLRQIPNYPVAGIRPPKPFPGSWPTRIIVNAQWKPRGSKDEPQRYSYFGKPSSNVMNVLKRLTKPAFPSLEGRVDYCELDLGGVIAHGGRKLPTSSVSHFSTVNYIAPLYHFYHPWTYGNWGMMQAFFEPFFLKKIKFHGKIWRVYSPLAQLKIEDHLRPFRRWLEGSGLGI